MNPTCERKKKFARIFVVWYFHKIQKLIYKLADILLPGHSLDNGEKIASETLPGGKKKYTKVCRKKEATGGKKHTHTKKKNMITQKGNVYLTGREISTDGAEGQKPFGYRIVRRNISRDRRH